MQASKHPLARGLLQPYKKSIKRGLTGSLQQYPPVDGTKAGRISHWCKSQCNADDVAEKARTQRALAVPSIYGLQFLER